MRVVALSDTHAPRRWKSCPPAAGRQQRLRRRFPEAGLVVFGHSHIPLDASTGGQRIFNPGSPTDRRRQQHGTVGVLTITAGVLVSAEIIAVSP
jgi:uncharacterized protein